jgi:hypothetical protein
LIAAITIQMSATSTDWPPLTPEPFAGCSTIPVAPRAMPIDKTASATAPNPTRPGTGSRRGAGCPYSRASTRRSISSPIRSTSPSAMAPS